MNELGEDNDMMYNNDISTEYIMSELFPIGRDRRYCEERSICFDAEAGYNTLTSPGVVLAEPDVHLRSMGAIRVFSHPDHGVLAAYMDTKHGVLLVKNPLESFDCYAGKTNALRFISSPDHENPDKPVVPTPYLYYHKGGCDWVPGRRAKDSADLGEEDIEVLMIGDDFPGIELIKESTNDTTLTQIIATLNNKGMQIPPTMPLLELLSMDELNELAYRDHDVAEILNRLTQLFLLRQSAETGE